MTRLPRKSRKLEFKGADDNKLVADSWGDPHLRTIVFLHGGGKRATPGAAPRSAWRNRAGMRSPWIYGVMAKATGPSSMPTRILPRTSSAWSPNCQIDRSSLVHRSEDLPLYWPKTGRQAPYAARSCSSTSLLGSDPQGVERIIGFMEAGKAGFDSLVLRLTMPLFGASLDVSVASQT